MKNKNIKIHFKRSRYIPHKVVTRQTVIEGVIEPFEAKLDKQVSFEQSLDIKIRRDHGKNFQ